MNGSLHSERTNLDQLIQLICDKYVDTLSYETLYQDGIQGIISHLDPHTVYIPPEELGRVNEELEGSFFGIGVEFYIHQDTVCISHVFKGGPSENSGLKPGDRILQINKEVVAGKNLDVETVIQKMRGKQNTLMRLSVLDLDQKTKEIQITRNTVPIHSVAGAFMLNQEVGYIALRMFSETTYDEFHQALSDLKKQGLKKLILDLRNNPGGYMDAAARVADEFISGEKLILSTRSHKANEELKTGDVGIFEEGPLAVLINENSASASEILAGAMQDHDRAIIVGRRSYGKGLVQEQFLLPDHSAIRITTARYYLPSGRCIQKSYHEGREKYEEDLSERYHQGLLNHQDTQSHHQKKKFYTDKKRIVYDGEGISPDYFIPVDTLNQAIQDSFYVYHIAEEFCIRIHHAHPAIFSAYKTVADFSQHFKISETIHQEFMDYIQYHRIPKTFMKNGLTSEYALQLLRAEWSKLLFGNNGYFLEMNKNDATVIAAMSHL
ncbi:MAG: S41 family peptidase [Chitinophagaceae bacterium]|nr:S41 family peptidase [Chitinophagaceae bacterium]